ncbi:GDSL-type esterase/lipase family protein [Atopococcus tabaci]|uniref:GDSL-type esterase/lipase family protein n=1 Tax=Atopococcus tabaci TaxID=269774 RepID=UPI002409F2AB|nr:GDSL-type esterase/lipase family protein [Atopococcus tabaci]
MKKFKSTVQSFLVFLVAVVATFAVLSLFVSTDEEDGGNSPAQLEEPPVPQDITMVALGDSLTEGVGDLSKRGGYVPVTSELLEDKEMFATVQAVNAGKSGATAADVQEIIQTNKELEDELASADMIVLSVGGNNLVQTLSQTGLNAPKEAFDRPLMDYRKDLTDLLNEVRKRNTEAPLYVFGIYNPYYYYFSEIEPLQQVIDMWNNTTEEVVEENGQSHFISIDHMFNTLDNVVSGEKIEEETEGTAQRAHPYLFQGDYFHPNEDGYRLMADALVEEIEQTWKTEQDTAEEQ